MSSIRFALLLPSLLPSISGISLLTEPLSLSLHLYRDSLSLSRSLCVGPFSKETNNSRKAAA